MTDTPREARVQQGLRARLTEIINAYDSYRARGVLPAPEAYAHLVAAIDRGRDALARLDGAPEGGDADAIEREYIRKQVTPMNLLDLTPSAPAALPPARGGAPEGLGWREIASAPKDEEVWFWVVPKTAEETYSDTSGKPILARGGGHRHFGRYKTWSSLYKGVMWYPAPPAPPLAEGTSTHGD